MRIKLIIKVLLKILIGDQNIFKHTRRVSFPLTQIPKAYYETEN